MYCLMDMIFLTILRWRDGSFEHPKQMYWLMDMIFFTILRSNKLYIWTYAWINDVYMVDCR